MPDARRIEGIIPPLVTPLTEEERLDEAGLRRVVEYVLEGGVGGVFVLGTSGEFPCLHDEERRRAIEVVVEQVAGRVPVFAGCHDVSTKRTIERAKEAAAAGPDYLVVTMPYYYTPSPEEMAAHVRAVADLGLRPVLIYNIPRTTKAHIPADAVSELSRHDNIVGIKDSSGDFGYLQSLVAAFRDREDFAVLQGNQPLVGPAVLLGARGAIPAIANLVPRLCVDLYEAARAGKVEETMRLQQEVNIAVRVMTGADGFPIARLKTALTLVGLCGPTAHRPHKPPTAKGCREIEGLLERLKAYVPA